MIYALVGKSCSGKSTAFHKLLSLGYETVISYTTRPIRPNETEGKEYQFITKEQFKELDDTYLIVAPRRYNDWSYGMNLLSIHPEKKQIIIVDPQGLESLTNDIGKHNVKSIYLDSPNEVRFLRGHNREDSAHEMNRRFQADEVDFKNIEKEVDYIVSSMYKEEAISKLLQIIEGSI